MIYVADTHPLVWYLEGNSRLSHTAHQAFRNTSVRLVVPTIVLVEIKYLYARRRISIDVPTTLHG